MMKKILLASVALTLAACASRPHEVATLTQMPSAYDYAGAMAAAEKNEGDWWKSFSDPALDALVADALAANQDIKAGLAAVESSRASVQVSKAAFFPQASGSVSGSSNSETGLDDVSGSARASASWELDLFGQNRAALAASRANLDAQIFDQRALELTVQSDVAFNYFSTLALRKQLEVARSNLEISERIYSIVKTRYDAGYVSGFDVASQEASLANARARLPQLERQLAGYEMALAILLGRTPQGYDAPEGDLLATTPPSINPGMPSELLLRRPDLLSAEAALRASDANVDAARAAFFPSIDLSAGASTALTGGADVITSLAGSLAAPIFSAGRLEGNLKGAKARAAQQVARYRQATLSALRDVDVGLKGLSAAEEREKQLEVAREAAGRSLSLAEIRYKSGADDLTSLLNAQSTYFSASDSLVQGRLDRLSAAIDLFVAIGGGWGEDGGA